MLHPYKGGGHGRLLTGLTSPAVVGAQHAAPSCAGRLGVSTPMAGMHPNQGLQGHQGP